MVARVTTIIIIRLFTSYRAILQYAAATRMLCTINDTVLRVSEQLKKWIIEDPLIL